MSQEVVLVTGATGLLGRGLCAYLSNRGYEVRALLRSGAEGGASAQPGVPATYKCNLPDEIDPRAFEGPIRALMHCAYDTRFTDRATSERTNVLGTERLLRLSRERQVSQFIFVSSLSADPDVKSYYGQSKLAAEALLDPARDLIVRPGLILGPGGLFLRMRKLVRALPVIPLFYGGQQPVQTVWLGDLCQAIVQAMEMRLTGIIRVAEAEGLSMKAFYAELCRLEGKRRWLVPFPGSLALLALRAIENLGVAAPISSENLLGLKALKHHDVAGDLAKLGLSVLSFRESLRKLAVAEGIAA
jgi:nucleoside-diphosphate-sugar epimerase